MNTAPKSVRMQIALVGMVNSGKSSLLNLLVGQNVSITSKIEGTTTDIVEKNQELPSLGPVTWLDTAGLGDTTELGQARMRKTLDVLARADIIMLVLNDVNLTQDEQQIVNIAKEQKTPIIKIYNKADIISYPCEGIKVNSLNLNSRDAMLNEIIAEIIKISPDEFIAPPPILSDLIPNKGVVVMIVPIDYEAPKGRLILPQVQAIRDALDYNHIVIITKENAYQDTLKKLNIKPDLVVCDSQIVDKMVQETPSDIRCTTFSTLFARLKGDINILAEGAATISTLKDGDKVLIAEACTHHAMEDDIGKVKIPNLLKKKTGKNLQIDFAAGHDFPDNLATYKLVIQCGGCMFGRREILSRINKCRALGIPITNYGICISELKGVLEPILQPFPEAWENYKRHKND